MHSIERCLVAVVCLLRVRPTTQSHRLGSLHHHQSHQSCLPRLPLEQRCWSRFLPALQRRLGYSPALSRRFLVAAVLAAVLATVLATVLAAAAASLVGPLPASCGALADVSSLLLQESPQSLRPVRLGGGGGVR